ncbi:hypothetical protein NDU88_011048 [Pleurodeles waltl]|uniref:Uncharacterized protein n=1 Tax=Pleurodeles waltl TaxID=8319 RepID=A0AAV7Q0G8_PLEWA|nr:hypothetical protein NDU88_011048 [Pleurodeles waltl]
MKRPLPGWRAAASAAYILAVWSRVSLLGDLQRETDSHPAWRPCCRRSGPADDAGGGCSFLAVLGPTRRCLRERACTLLTNNLHVRLSPLGGGSSGVLLSPWLGAAAAYTAYRSSKLVVEAQQTFSLTLGILLLPKVLQTCGLAWHSSELYHRSGEVKGLKLGVGRMEGW